MKTGGVCGGFFAWLRSQAGQCRDAHNSILPARSSQTREGVRSVPVAQEGSRPTSTPTPAAPPRQETGGDVGAGALCLCPCSLMDSHLPLLTLVVSTLCLDSRSPVSLACPSLHLPMSRFCPFKCGSDTAASTGPSLPADNNAFPTLSRPCPVSAPSGTEHVLPSSHPGPSLSHSPVALTCVGPHLPGGAPSSQRALLSRRVSVCPGSRWAHTLPWLLEEGPGCRAPLPQQSPSYSAFNAGPSPACWGHRPAPHR